MNHKQANYKRSASHPGQKENERFYAPEPCNHNEATYCMSDANILFKNKW
jgi:hypothetical protein